MSDLPDEAGRISGTAASRCGLGEEACPTGRLRCALRVVGGKPTAWNEGWGGVLSRLATSQFV